MSTIYLNGFQTSYESLDWFALNEFNISNGFLPTINTLEFHVNNAYTTPGADNPTGLLVQNLVATPEPATMGLLALGGIGLLRQKK